MKSSNIVYQVLCVVLLTALIVMAATRGVSDSAGSGQETAPAPGGDEWRSIEAAELTDNPFTVFSYGMILAAGTEGDMNAMAIGWGGFGVLWGHTTPVITVYVEKSRYTHEFMERNEYFTVTALPDELCDKMLYMGRHSGRDTDKIDGSGLTLGFTELGNPIFEEGRLFIECRKIYSDDFDPSGFGELGRSVYSNGRQLHTIYIGEIIDIRIK